MSKCLQVFRGIFGRKLPIFAGNRCNNRRMDMLGVPAALPDCPARLCRIIGHSGRVNDVVYCRPINTTENSSVVVFFGGDVQDFTENMKSHRDNKNYIKWNLENTAQNLQMNFIDAHIVVIRPSRMEFKTFSCYENFVPSNKCGAPEHTPMNYALHHLEKLLRNISNRLQTMSDCDLSKAMDLSRSALVQDDAQNGSTEHVDGGAESVESTTSPVWEGRQSIDLGNCDIKLIGFSKGCVVLNQFLYEFHYFKTLKPEDVGLQRIISRIKDMYWLDGGHSGGKNTWITSRALLETLARLEIKVHIHVTPYQIQDDRRPWIKKEEKMFYDILKKQGAPVERVVHFEDVVPSLLLHFDVLNVFRSVVDNVSPGT